MSQSKGKKRDREDENEEPCKRERLMKLCESKRGSSEEDEYIIKLEEATAITGKDGGISGASVVDQVLELMRREENNTHKNWCETVSKRILLSTVIVGTEDEECLSRFLQLGGLSVLDKWLQDAHKMNSGDQDWKNKENSVDDLILVLLNALGKLSLDLDALKGCSVGKSVNNLLSHTNIEIQKKARKLLDAWKKHVDAEMKSIACESKHGSDSVSATQSSGEILDVKCCTPEKGKEKLGMNYLARNIITGDADSNHVISNALNDASPPISSSISKESSFKHDLSGGAAHTDTSTTKAENDFSPQSPSQLRSSLSIKGTGFQKDDAKDAASPISIRTSVQSVNSHGEGGQHSSPCHDKAANADSKSVCACSGVQSSVTTSQDKRTSDCNCRDVNSSEMYCEAKERVQFVIAENGVCTSSEQIIDNQSGNHQLSDAPMPQTDDLEKGIITKIETNDIDISRNIGLLASITASEGSGEETSVLNGEYCTPKTSCTKAVNLLVEPGGKADVNMASLSRVPKRVLMSPSCSAFKDSDACPDKTEATGNQDWHNRNSMASVCKEKDHENVDDNDDELDESQRIVVNCRKSFIGKFSGVYTTSEGSTGSFEVEDALDVARQVAKEIEQELDSRRKSLSQDSQDSPPSPLVSNINKINMDSEDELITSNDNQDIGSTKSEGIGTFELTNSLDNEGIIHQDEATSPKKNDYLIDKDKDTVVGTLAAHVQATDEQVTSQEVASASVDNDGNSSAAMARPVFDLNEGVDFDDDCHSDALVSTIHVENVHSVSDDLACPPASSSTVTAPIAVIALATGFVPPSDLLMAKADLGWKGSAATSAFRPTEPRRANKQPSGTAVKSETNNVKHSRNFNIDLNVSSERVLEDTCGVMEDKCITPLKTQCPQDGSLSITSTVRRLELDLNRTEGTDEIMLPSVKSREAAGHNMLDFDLNDGPGVDDCIMEDSYRFVQDQGNNGSSMVLPMRDNASHIPWHTVESVDKFSGIRADMPYSSTAPRKSNTEWNNTLSSSNNNNVPLTSGSFDRKSTIYPTGPAQSESAGWIPSIPYGRMVSVIKISDSDTHLSWSRPEFDLNIGPDSA